VQGSVWTKEFHGLRKAAFHEVCKRIHFVVRLEDVEIPGHRKMAVDVEEAAIFDDAKIMEIDPVLAAMFVDIADHFLQELQVGLVHDAGDAFAQDMIACIEDNACEDERDGRRSSQARWVNQMRTSPTMMPMVE